jgi:hypothetical protein
MLRRLLQSLIVLATACGSSPHGAGTACTDDTQCSAGLHCLEIDTFQADGSCIPSGMVCSMICATDADCSSLRTDTTLTCRRGCGVLSVCGLPLRG